MHKKEIPEFFSDSDTRNRILDTATKLFALKGFKAVTLNEIAKAVGIKIASIYYYYEDKEALIQDVLARFEDVYGQYHDWLFTVNEKAESLDEVMGNLFSQEFLDKLSPISRLGMSMVLKEQHRHESASQCAVKHIYKDAVRNIHVSFDRLIEKKIIPPSDTKTLATIFMFCVIAGNEIEIHKFAENEAPIDCSAVYDGLRKLTIAALTQGILKVD